MDPSTTSSSVSAQRFVDRLLANTQHSRAASAVAGDQTPRRLACMVTHGMGQQVPFETIADLAEAYGRGSRPMTMEADRIQLTEDGDLQMCMRLLFPKTPTEPTLQVDIFEGYWAPLTEGKISFLTTMLFLVSAGWRAIKTCLSTTKGTDGTRSFGLFSRWVFGHLHEFPIKRRTLSMLLTMMSILLVIAGLVYGAQLAVQGLWKTVKHHLPPPVVHTGSLGDRLGTTFVGALQYVRELSIIAMHHWAFLVGIAALCFIAYWINYFIVEFGGDVVIYVASYKVSAFQEIRDAIQARVLAVGKQIVEAKDADSGKLLYDGLIFVGHSLGSVVTYDLVNALLVWDATGCNGQHDLLHRIHRLITFGSPLDKTAFLFRTQVKSKHHYREAMAGTMQPLILDYAMRPFPWVNLYSPLDPVCGQLAYYDLPAASHTMRHAFRVENIRDPKANWPIRAHVQYWQNDLLTQQLMLALKRPDQH